MKIAIIGGKIKGVEVAVLARLAGINTVLIDKDNLTPASGLCDESLTFDVIKKESALLSVLKNVDMVVPALTEREALNAIEELCREINIQVAFDFITFDITNNKIQMDVLLKEEKYPHLKYYPDAKPPFVLKPAEGSRRKSIKKVNTVEEVEFLMSRKDFPESWIAQEFVPGPIYSIEVIGKEGDYKAYEVTKLDLDSDLDCNMSSCPSHLDQKNKDDFTKYALALANKVQLTGIMHAEAVLDNDSIKIVEINSIFPTHSPITIFYSTGVNILVELLDVYLDDKNKGTLSQTVNKPFDEIKHVVRKNFQFANKTPTFSGEYEMDDAGPLKLRMDFFDAYYAITDYIDDDHEWQAAFINISDSEDELLKKRINAREVLLQHCRKLL